MSFDGNGSKDTGLKDWHGGLQCELHYSRFYMNMYINSTTKIW